MKIETLTKQELLIIATYCNSDGRKKDVEFNKTEIKKLGEKLLIEVAESLQQIKPHRKYLITYHYTDRTDISLHSDVVTAVNSEDAINKVCSNHNNGIEWHTVEEIFSLNAIK